MDWLILCSGRLCTPCPSPVSLAVPLSPLLPCWHRCPPGSSPQAAKSRIRLARKQLALRAILSPRDGPLRPRPRNGNDGSSSLTRSLRGGSHPLPIGRGLSASRSSPMRSRSACSPWRTVSSRSPSRVHALAAARPCARKAGTCPDKASDPPGGTPLLPLVLRGQRLQGLRQVPREFGHSPPSWQRQLDRRLPPHDPDRNHRPVVVVQHPPRPFRQDHVLPAACLVKCQAP